MGEAGRVAVPFRRSLQLKVSLGVLLALAVMLAVVLVVFYLRGYELLEARERALTSSAAQRLAGEMGQQLALAEGVAASLANLGELLPRDPELWRTLVPRLIDIEPHPHLIAGGGLWPEPGEFRAGVERHSFFWGRDADGKLKFFDDYNAASGPGYHQEEWYVPARHQRDGRCYWSRSYQDPYTFEPMVTCTVPMRRDGRFLGVSTIDLRLSGLQRFLDERAVALQGYAFAVDRSGIFLTLPPVARAGASTSAAATTGPPSIGAPLRIDALERELPDFGALASFLREREVAEEGAEVGALAAGIDVATPAIEAAEARLIAEQLRDPGTGAPRLVQTKIERDPFLNEPVLVTVLRIPAVHWQLAVVQPARVVREAVLSVLARMAGALVVGIVAVAALAGWAVRRTLVMPIRSMASQLAAAEGAGVPGRVEVRGTGELDFLAGRFNDYADQLAESHAELLASAQQFRAVTELAHDALLQIDEEGWILSLNRAGEQIFGYAESDVVGKHFQMLLPWDPRSDPAIEGDVVAGADDGDHGASRAARRMLELSATRRDGSEFPAEVSVSFWRGPRRAIYNIQVRDVTDRRRVEEQVRLLATHDALTGLPNRTLFQDRLGQAVEASRRDGSPLAVLFLDLDHFKLANDSLGHGIGDSLLRAVADRLRESARAGDTVARLGGDEFAVLLPDLASPGVAVTVAHRVLETIGRDFEVEGNSVRVGVSIGATLCPDDDVDADQLLRKADMAMYHAKAEGRNTFRFFTERLQAELVERKQLLDLLAMARDRGELELHYQPILALGSHELHGLEALLRWRHPRLGLVEPDRFVGLAEQSGLIVDIGEWVFAQALADLASWDAAGLPRLRMAINLSLAQFRDPDLVERLADGLASAAIAADRVELELTESVLMHDVESGLEILRRLRELGVGLAVDDFGTGYSSLSYLNRFPVQKLKIDRSMVQGVAAERETAAICRSVIGLGHNLGLALVGEGVERTEDLDFLRLHGCDFAQGFHFSPARPIGEVRDWAARNATSGGARRT
jgi:diguanylate cyclase (GGDEF)-like protein/PAS domain S-box-containing protein